MFTAVVIVIVTLLAVYFRRTKLRQEDKIAGRPVNGDLTATQEKRLFNHLTAADLLFARLMASHDVMDLANLTVLGERDRQALEAWRVDFTKLRKTLHSTFEGKLH